MKMENRAKFEIADAICRKLDIAMSFGNSRKVFLDFTAPADYPEHIKILNELKKDGVIKDFKIDGDSFDIFEPIKYKLYEIKSSLLAESKIQELTVPRKLSFDPVLALVKNIYKTYVNAPDELKRLYLGLFWERFEASEKLIQRAEPTDLIKAMIKE